VKKKAVPSNLAEKGGKELLYGTTENCREKGKKRERPWLVQEKGTRLSEKKKKKVPSFIKPIHSCSQHRKEDALRQKKGKGREKNNTRVMTAPALQKKGEACNKIPGNKRGGGKPLPLDGKQKGNKLPHFFGKNFRKREKGKF